MDNKKSEDSTAEIIRFIREHRTRFNKDGIVLGLSGGLDSAVAAYLCIQALGTDCCHFLHLPDLDSNPRHTDDARMIAENLGVRLKVTNISPMLRKSRFYRLLPLQYIPFRFLKEKLVNIGKKYLGVTEERDILLSRVSSKAGSWIARANAYVSGKHRMRLVLIYKYAEENNLVVVGAANRTELLTGTYVQWGIDQCADIMPLIHLYRSQLPAIAAYLGVPEEIINKPADPDVLPGVSNKEALLGSFVDVDRVLMELEQDVPPEQLYVRFGKDLVMHIHALYNQARYMREVPYSLI